MFGDLFPKIFIGFVILFLVYGLIQFCRGNPNWGITIGKIYTPFGKKEWTLWGDGHTEESATGIFKKKKRNTKRKRR